MAFLGSWAYHKFNPHRDLGISMYALLILMLTAPPSEAGKRSAKALRLKRQAEIKARILKEPQWKSPEGEED